MLRRWSVPADARPSIAEFRRLSHEGLSLAELDDSPLLELVPQAVEAERRVARLRAALVSVINERLPDRRAELRYFFALDGASWGLKARHKEIAKLFDAAAWDQIRKEPVDRLLLAVYTRLREELGTDTPTSDVSGGLAPRFLMDSISAEYHFPQHAGEQRLQFISRRGRAPAEGLEEWTSTHRYNRPSGSSHPETLLHGGVSATIEVERPTLVRTRPRRQYSIVTHVRFVPPLPPYAPAQWSILRQQRLPISRLISPGGVDSWVFALVVPINKLDVRLVFPAQKPRVVWRVDGMPEWLAPGVDDDSNRILIRMGRADAEFSGCRPGLAYGIAWQWPG